VSPIDDYKLLNKINEIVHKGLVLVSYEGNEITGSIAGIRISDWWSSEPILSDIWFYVSPLHRKSRSALMLIKAFIKIAKDAKVKIRLGHIYSGDIERKDKFYEKLGLVKAGSTYVEKK
jgi:GNAT superfamily N-acetyltransferase